MADVYDKSKRSQIMRTIKSKNSKAELLVFDSLKSKKLYFKKHYIRAEGKPDIAIPSKKLAVFIDGDFWHGRKGYKLPDNSYWQSKILANKKRDAYVEEVLKNHGWKLKRTWETDILRKRTRESALSDIYNFLTR